MAAFSHAIFNVFFSQYRYLFFLMLLSVFHITNIQGDKPLAIFIAEKSSNEHRVGFVCLL